MIRVKHGVYLTGLRAEMLLAISIADQVYSEKGYECVITSVVDSTHSNTSRHYLGMAVDFRTRHLPNDAVALEITNELRERLGVHYLVLFEHNHIHIGYQPKKS